jgi:periplasmic protein TonB
MLEDALFESRGRKKTRNPVTVALSVLAHVVTIGLLILIPLLQTQALTIPPIDMSLWIPKQPKPITAFSAQPRVQKHIQINSSVLTEPTTIPARIAYVDEPAPPNPGFIPSPGGGDRIGSVLIGIVNRQPEVEAPPVAPPPPPTPPPPLKASPIRVSVLEKASLLHQVNPVYPPLARQTRVQGPVVLEATISKEGSIEQLKIISGHPLLTQAALDAVKQWKYRPVLLNGQPVDVITSITVNFTLQ